MPYYVQFEINADLIIAFVALIFSISYAIWNEVSSQRKKTLSLRQELSLTQCKDFVNDYVKACSEFVFFSTQY